jgi:RES domain-containing protein
VSVTVAIWRIATDTPNYTSEDRSGAGSASTGGRWNMKGTPVVYAAGSIALACLETLVHLNGNDLPYNRYLVKIKVPLAVWKSRMTLDTTKKNVGWDALPFGKVSIDAGEKWVKEQKSALLVVPSIIVPRENNVLINPAHPDATKLIFDKLEKWRYDTRLTAKSDNT